jgi:Mlc titration factor MtfA (ptsG expression regulator)
MYIILIIIIVAGVAYFLFRKKGETSIQTSVNYQPLLQTHISYYQNLDAAGKAKFEGLVSGFLQGVHIEGVGTDVNDLDKVMVASSAVIPIFGFDGWKYKNLTNVILYPDTFDQEFQFEGGSRNILGMVGSGYMNGQMLLSRAALVKGFSKSSGKENTAIHEFVHLLDKADGATDGIPENLLAHQYSIPWLHLMHQEMHKIAANKSDINPYATTNEAEFLAVAAEYFFEKPDQFHVKHPELYQMLSLIFAQDPASA